MRPKEIIQLARATTPSLPDTTVLQLLAYSPVILGDDNSANDQNEILREDVCIQLSNQLHPDDRLFIRYLLEQEISLHKHEQEGMLPNLKRCAYLLYRLSHVEDSLLIWRAKDTHFDTMCGIDVQLLIGGGLALTLAYLEAQPDSTDIIEYITACKETGDFSNMDSFEREIEQYFE